MADEEAVVEETEPDSVWPEVPNAQESAGVDLPEEKKDEPEPEPEVKVEEKPKTKDWDKERQRYDQELANIRKANEAAQKSMQDAVESMRRDMIAALKGAQSDQKPREPDILDGLDPDKLFEEPAKFVNALKHGTEAQRDLAKKFQERMEQKDAEQKALRDEVEAMKAQLAEKAEKEAARDKINSMLDTLDEKFGARFRNRAITKAQDMLKEDGHSQDNPPSQDAVRIALRAAYAELAATETKEEKPKKKGVTLDAGRGGVTADNSDTWHASGKSYGEVLASIKARRAGE